MNINGFFLIIFVCLIFIYVAFEPLDIHKQNTDDVPLFELKTFTMRKLDQNGLVDIMQGSKGYRFKNYSKIKDMNYTDNSKEYISNLKTKLGTYKDDSEVFNLNGKVVYTREDGLIFKTKKLTYNQKRSIATTNTSYVMHTNSNIARGTSMVYDNKQGKMKSKNIRVKYQLKEDKK